METRREIYDPKGLALEIFQKRYALTSTETWVEGCKRVAAHVAMGETPDQIAEWTRTFSQVLEENLFMPGGRIWYGCGRPKGQLLNCFVIPTADSREGWGRSVSDMIVIAGTGGGVGLNGSPIRPRNSPINGSGGKATGSVSLFEIVNAAGEVIKAGGGRRTALMLALNLTHGDIEEFLDKKLDKKQLNNANVSVVFDENPERFFELVKSEADLELKFRGKVIGKAPAAALWKKIVHNALQGGEPGILNGYLANKMNNIWYYKPVICTNPCGEIWLIEYDCCDLGALVLPRFVVGKEIDWSALEMAVKVGVRFLDDVLTVNNYPLAEIKETCSNIRRVGLGIMGLHDMLLLTGHKYTSDSGLELVDKVMNFIKNTAYSASIDLAIEKGSFPKFDPDLFLKGGFVRNLKPSIRSRIKEHGIRNCALLTIAPTGTTSMVCDVTSGIEPMFAPAYRRKFRDTTGELKSEVVIHPLLRDFMEKSRSVKHFQGAMDLKIRDHFEMQRTCQKHLDNACSKTINLPQGTSEEELSALYMEFLPELKGVTVYPDGSREDQPLTPMSLDDAMVEVENAKFEATAKDSCKDGYCEI
ncbi:MAG: adenosylcobalamin-dependent ribonucleoside-diphosphate reductase [Acidiferrobacterales bacterium]